MLLKVGSQWSEQPKNVHFEPIIRKLDWDQDRFHLYKIQLQKKKQKCLLIFCVQKNKYETESFLKQKYKN